MCNGRLQEMKEWRKNENEKDETEIKTAVVENNKKRKRRRRRSGKWYFEQKDCEGKKPKKDRDWNKPMETKDKRKKSKYSWKQKNETKISEKSDRDISLKNIYIKKNDHLNAKERNDK